MIFWAQLTLPKYIGPSQKICACNPFLYGLWRTEGAQSLKYFEAFPILFWKGNKAIKLHSTRLSQSGKIGFLDLMAVEETDPFYLFLESLTL